MPRQLREVCEQLVQRLVDCRWCRRCGQIGDGFRGDVETCGERFIGLRPFLVGRFEVIALARDLFVGGLCFFQLGPQLRSLGDSLLDPNPQTFDDPVERLRPLVVRTGNRTRGLVDCGVQGLRRLRGRTHHRRQALRQGSALRAGDGSGRDMAPQRHERVHELELGIKLRGLVQGCVVQFAERFDLRDASLHGLGHHPRRRLAASAR